MIEPVKTYRPTWAEIDLGAIRHNCAAIQDMVGKNTGIMAVVKANAYGHGLVRISKLLDRVNIRYLGVATLDEAIHQFVMGNQQSLLVTHGDEVVGILRLTDVFAAVFHTMKECVTD